MEKALGMSAPVLIISKPYPKTPLLMEVAVPDNLDGPFLVSGTQQPLWIEDKFPSGDVRAAVIKSPRDFMFRSAVIKVAAKSKELSWGSANPCTKAGVQASIDHLAYYGLVEVEAYFGDGFDPDLFPEGLVATEEVWVPSGWAVILPQDKSFVGTLFDFGQDRNSLVIHNAARGVGLLVPEGS
jgi:hypothetical protein